MNAKDFCKQSLYFPSEMLLDLKQESIRLDRSYSWIMQMAWKIAKEQIRALPVQGPQ